MKAKKLLAMILSLTMILGLCTVGAKATDEGGRTLTLEIAHAGSSTPNDPTRFTVKNGDDVISENVTLQDIFGSAHVAQEGDTFILPAGNIYIANCVDIYCSASLVGEGEGQTTLVKEKHGERQILRVTNYTTGHNTTLTLNINNLTIDGGLKNDDCQALYLGGNLTLNLSHVTIKDCCNKAIHVEGFAPAYKPLGDGVSVSDWNNKGVTINASYLTTTNNGKNGGPVVMMETSPNSIVVGTNRLDAITTYTKFYYDDTCNLSENVSKYFAPNSDSYVGYENCLVYKNGVLEADLLPADAQIGDTFYATLKDAITAAQAGDTIELLDDVDMTDADNYTNATSNRIPIAESLTIDGGNHTITVAKRGFGVGEGAAEKIDVTFRNVTITNADEAARCIDTRGNLNSLTLENVTLDTNAATSGYTQPLTIGGDQADAADIVIRNSTIQTSDDASAYYAIITFNPVNMTIEDSTIKGWACIYAKPATGSAGSAGSVFNITDSTLTSTNKYYGETNAFAMFMFEDDNITVNVTDSQLFVNANSDQNQALTCTQDDNQANTIVNIGGNSSVTLNGEKAVFADNSGHLSITGGTYNSDPNQYVAEGYVGNKIDDDKYVVGPIVKVEDTEESATVTDEASGVSVTFDTDSNNDLTAADSSLEANSSLALVVEPKEPTDYNAPETDATIEDIIDITVKKTTVTKDEYGVVQSTVTEEVPITNVTSTVSYYYPNYNPSKVYKVYYFPGGTEAPVDMNATYNPATKSFEFVIKHNSEYGIVSNEITNANKAEKIQVAFKPTGEANVYDIVLLGKNNAENADKYIHGFTSADLTFQLDIVEGNPNCVSYVIDPVAGMTTLNDSKAATGRYEFNMDGIHFSRANGSNIKIGTVTFLGYGKIDFKVTDDATNVVNTTKLNDSIVEHYTVAGGVLTINSTDATTNAAPTALIDNLLLSPVSKSLTVNVMFPNDAANQVKAYQDMTMTISGGDLYEDIVINLGSDAAVTGKNFMNQALALGTDVTVAYNGLGSYGATPTACNQYAVSIPATLHKDIRYTVTVSGAGYRSARYSLNMSGDKTLTFWNNVMDDDTVIETGNDATKVKVTYLAGDIVKDEQINIYDLSAVVSYFGTTGLTADNLPEYAKYDLNRDGKIDSIDVAYVLVSWGK